jgi:hypothetical protein
MRKRTLVSPSLPHRRSRFCPRVTPPYKICLIFLPIGCAIDKIYLLNSKSDIKEYNMFYILSRVAASTRPHSLKTGKITGNFWNFRTMPAFLGRFAADGQVDPTACSQFPVPAKAGNFFGRTGNPSAGTGNSPTLVGSNRRLRAVALIRQNSATASIGLGVAPLARRHTPSIKKSSYLYHNSPNFTSRS